MDTYFATPEKADSRKLASEIELVSNSAIVTALLHSVSGMLAVLNEHRQVIALNDSFLDMLGIEDPQKHFGMRPGEILHCIHAQEGPSGCGTTKFCCSCGAAIAIVSSLEQEKPIERICALTAVRGKKQVDVALLVQSNPFRINSKLFLLLFIQDISQQQQQAALARTFFHDVNNLLFMLVGASEILVEQNPSDLTQTIFNAASRLQQEVAIQRCLTEGELDNYKPMWNETSTEDILDELQSFFAIHPAAHQKKISISNNHKGLSIRTDTSLLLRVLCNMIINAFEATEKNGVIKIWLDSDKNHLSFCVWNHKTIPQNIANRIFQRNFTTKDQTGRGVGTYSMKLFGEKILGGSVDFTTSLKDGTVFRLMLPL